jgi:exopolyphosphatase/guanosine-5'-triphosphate,3'-diphosphate pyrophosphatase
MKQGLTSYDATRVHNSVLWPADVAGLARQLLTSPVADVRARYPFLEPMRAEVICAGALIAAAVTARVGSPMTVRETDILDGAALALVNQLS